MIAMTLTSPRAGQLERLERPEPVPRAGEIRVRVRACGVCRTDLHVVDGELPQTPIPIVPGHEIVGVVDVLGDGVDVFTVGDRVGIPWLGFTCGRCEYCASGRENLCPNARFTGYTRDGGYADATIADARYAFRIPDRYDDATAAPLLCAGLIGYRAYRMTGPGRRLGLYGFGAAAHLLAQVAIHDGREVLAFTSPGDSAAQAFARSLGCVWAGASSDNPPEHLDAAIIFAPVGSLVPRALAQIVPGGVVVCAGIHMSDIPAFPYELLWKERVVRSVANLTRRDAHEFLAVAPSVPVITHVQKYKLLDANQALADLRAGRVNGAAVLVVEP
jgi:alcohol dehydrogenase, propanol-preferring